MIGSIQGTLEDIEDNLVTINCGGVGYDIFVSQTALDKLEIGAETKVFTYLNINSRDNEMSLFGFASKEEKKMFLNLTSVSGIGPKTAMTIVGSTNLYDLASSIASGDSSVIARVKGIGKKSADRIVLELREKMEKTSEFSKLPLENGAAEDSEQEYAINVLLTLGLNRFDATKRVREVSTKDDKAEEIIQKVLRSM